MGYAVRMRSIWFVGALAIAACGKKTDDAAKQQLAFRKTAVQIHLKKLTQYADMHYAELAAFPVGKAGPTPAEPCCKGADQKCPAAAEWTTDPVWSRLHYAVADAGYFQYAYEGAADGNSATLTAVGDLDCDGTPITYRVKLTGGLSGVKVSAEAPAQDAF